MSNDETPKEEIKKVETPKENIILRRKLEDDESDVRRPKLTGTGKPRISDPNNIIEE